MREFLRRRFSREEVVGLSFTLSFLTCAALAVALGLLAHEIREDKGLPQPVDTSIRNAIVAERSPERTREMRAVTFVGDQRFFLFAMPVVSAGLWAGRRHVSALLFAGSVLGGFGLSSVLKIALARARPEQWAALVKETTYSFPSGHTTMATVFFGGLAAIVFHLTKKPVPRIAAALAAAAIVVAVATSRVYLGAHWATDTFAGMLTGLVWVVVFSTTTETMEKAKALKKAKEAKSQGGAR
ncbi:MAG TPA: phosphatase PAP2 family protein [Thermoanaerobaculia bacterium]|jgi:undecaprenyl-diphosphatase|nr:phosphatase PAP2 family protein [Thermoanaerobaculia bacterium]